MKVFLSIITRCYKRPVALRRNQLSVGKQMCGNYEQIFLVDEIGLGIKAADERMAIEASALIRGEYVYILDDDDLLIDNQFVAHIHAIARSHDPDIIMVKSDNGRLGILPGAETWEREPQPGRVSVLNYVVKAEVWKRHASAFATHPDDAGDAMFIVELFKHDYSVYWFDSIVAMTNSMSGRNHGRSE